MRKDPMRQMKRLRQLCADVVALRRGDLKSEWLKIEQERMDLHSKQAEAVTFDKSKVNE
jgi:hypothetical protein